jgi:hypothetical protein
MRVFQNNVLRIIFDPKGEEVTDGWRKLHDLDIHNLHSLSDIFLSRGSSVSIVTDYGLDDRGSIPDRGRGFFF